MKIVFAIHAPRNRETAVFAYSEGRGQYLESQGHEVEIWSQDDDPVLGRVKPRWWPFVFPWRVASRLAEHPVDVAIFHSYTGWAFHLRRKLSPRFRRRVERTRTVAQFHGVETLEYRSLEQEMVRAGKPTPLRHHLLQRWVMPRLLRWGCREAECIFCLNQAERRYFVAQGWAREGQIEIVPNAAPDEILELAPRRRQGGARRLLFLGQWLERKGVRQLAAAFSILAKERPEITLHCVGTRTPDEQVLASFPRDVRDRIEVWERATRAEVARALAEADVFVLPSFFEGSSLALLEAMASGLPIVTTPVGAAVDLLEPNAGAIFAEAGDAESLAAALRRMLDDEALRHRLSERARAVAETLAWSRLQKAYGEIILAVGRSSFSRRIR